MENKEDKASQAREANHIDNIHELRLSGSHELQTIHDVWSFLFRVGREHLIEWEEAEIWFDKNTLLVAECSEASEAMELSVTRMADTTERKVKVGNLHDAFISCEST